MALSPPPAGLQSALAPAGPEAGVVAEMTWVLVIGGTLILALVTALALWSIAGRRQFREQAFIVAGGIVFPAVTLAILLVYTLVRGAEVRAPVDAALRIEVTGLQWWWRVRYLDAEGRPVFETANEIRIPVGKAVLLELKSSDVIHSFWVPSLAGKLDMIPGRTTRFQLQATQAGDYRGQCAEYCGGPHALMAFFVVAEPQEAFDAWARGQRRDAERSSAPFQANCAGCHTVRGTPAAGTLGPDLTHAGSRRTIGAALLPMNAGALAAWIASSQHLKPGNLMPSFEALRGEELRDIAAYVESLK
jgi:cytochrome c oxidase subunit 2